MGLVHLVGLSLLARELDRLVVPGIGRVLRESERVGRKIKGCKVDEMSMVVTGG